MSEPVVVTERVRHTLVARLNRPEARNAVNPAVMEGLGRAVMEAEGDVEVRALVLTGTGDRAFCGGMDLRAFADGETMAAPDPEAMKGFWRLLDGRVSVPVIGAAQATAVAGGFELLLGCDLIVVSSEAKLGLPEVKRSLFPAGGGVLLATRIPLSIAMEISLTGDPITPERACDLGLVNAVVAPDAVLDTALAYADRIAENGPLGVAAAKELVRLGVSDAAAALARREELQKTVFASEDAKEGALAFVEKREPVWKGR
jgi:enoyl-CoA hydratase